MLVDLRSDTLTKPTPGMLSAMMAAEVGDDIFGEDPSVNELEQKCAELFGMDGAVYCPSGTMANQIGMAVLTQPYDEVICYDGAHIYRYEGGGLVGNSGVSVRLVEGDRGRLSANDVLENINPDDQHFPSTTVVELENTVNKAGGSYYTVEDIKQIREVCSSNGLRMHLDGARLFNALAGSGDTPAQYGELFETISICLSKGLGAPVGSVLIYKKEFERAARRQRKVFGGGMRQAGFLAAAGIYALDNHIERLKEDHKKAMELGVVLSGCSWVESVMPVETNIVIFRVASPRSSAEIVEKLEALGIRSIAFGPNDIRLVTHLDFTDDMMEYAVNTMKSLEL